MIPTLASVAKALRIAVGRFTTEPDVAVLAFGLINAQGKIGATVDPTTGGLVSAAPLQVITGDGAITIKNGTVILSKGSAAAITIGNPAAGSPVAGGDDGKVLRITSTTAQAHTVTYTAGFGGGTTARDVATFGGAINDGFEIVAYNGVWQIQNTRNVSLG